MISRISRVGMSYLVLCVCLISLAGTATGTSIISSATGLSSPATTITFSEIVLPDNTSLTNQYAGLGVTFSGGYFYNPCPGCAVPPPSGAAPWIADFPGGNTAGGSQLTTMALSGPTNGIAFNFAGEFVPFTFTALLAGSTVGQFTVTIDTTAVNGTSGWGWYGFSNLTLDTLQISTTVAPGSVNGFELDNLELGSAASVPEPSTFVLLGSGALFFLVRRLRS